MARLTYLVLGLLCVLIKLNKPDVCMKAEIIFGCMVSISVM